jgi:hypothetical protein
LKHFGKNGNKNGADDNPASDGDAVGRLVAVVVVAEGEDVEAFPVGPAHAALHSAAERFGVEGGTAADCDVVAAHCNLSVKLYLHVC